jgi:hypothetical protein
MFWVSSKIRVSKIFGRFHKDQPPKFFRPDARVEGESE